MTDYDCIHIHSKVKYDHYIIKMLRGKTAREAFEEVSREWWDSYPIEQDWYGKLFYRPYYALFQHPEGQLKVEHMYQNHFRVTLL